jgi:ABC-type polysaccharide/polyol phosphate export permease
VNAPATSGLGWLISDSLVLARRNLEHVRQIPEKLLDVTLQPLMFVVLFSYVFGGVIAIPGGSYREYLLGGVLVQTLGFGLMGPATSIATDLREGVVDRLRSLPMARAAYLIGHVLAEMAASSIAVLVLSLSGLVVGWRIHADVPHALAGYGLVLLFAFAMVWCGTLLGLLVRSPDAAQGVVFMLVFPLTFVASTFVPIAGLNPFLRVVAEWNPVSAMAAAVRWLFGNPTGTPPDAAWPLQHPVLAGALWCLAILAICVPLALRRFRLRTTG